ncbi:hypothetical protein C0J52_16822 [Blattella germanica]|nr:hypothetical protein C0J52_16822 [Blattella germanica]
MTYFTGAERAYCVSLFQDSQSATVVQSRFRTQFGKDPPSRPFNLGTKHLSRLCVLLAIPNVGRQSTYS